MGSVRSLVESVGSVGLLVGVEGSVVVPTQNAHDATHNNPLIDTVWAQRLRHHSRALMPEMPRRY